MAKIKSQVMIIKKELEKNKVVNNVSAINNGYGVFILRLGAIIHILRHTHNMDITTVFLDAAGKRNTHYLLNSINKTKNGKQQ